jgi:hypothetical protein
MRITITSTDGAGTSAQRSPELERRMSAARRALVALAIASALVLTAAIGAPSAYASSGGVYTFASIGDSVASGEGNPDGMTEGLLPQAIWDDGLGPTLAQFYPSGTKASPCHQSQWAPPTLAKNEFEQETARWVSYTQLACAGANIPQVIANQVPELPGGHIDALMMTLGANDIDGGFAHLIETCLKEHGYCQNNESFTSGVNKNLEELPALFEGLHNALAEHDIGNVLISEYYDPTHNAQGTFGDSASNQACALGLLNAGTWQWAYEHVLTPLNQAIRKAAKLYGWHLVTGIEADFRNHGFCAWTQDQHWVRAFFPSPVPLTLITVIRELESFAVELQINGTAHPNHQGEADIAGHIRESLYAALGVPSTRILGQTPAYPYSFGSETTEPVQLGFDSESTLGRFVQMKATYYSINDAACSPEELSACVEYHPWLKGPRLLLPGSYKIKYFAENVYGAFEQPQTQLVRIAPPPLPNLHVTAEATAPSGTKHGAYKFDTWTPDDVTVTIAGTGTLEYALDDGGACASAGGAACKEATLPLTLQFTGEGAHYLDVHGGEGATGVLPVKIARKPPTITFLGYSSAPTHAGWNNGPVTLTWRCSATGAPPLASLATATVSAEGASQTASASCQDQTGRTAHARKKVSIDTQPPDVLALTTSITPKETGEKNLPVFAAPFTVKATAVDALSGLQGCTSASYSGPRASGASVSGTCTDRAGNQVGWSYSFDYAPPQLLTLSSQGTRLAAGAAVAQTAVVDGCGFRARGKLLANGKETDPISITKPEAATCASGAITEDRLAGSGKAEFLAGTPIRITAVTAFGACTYHYSKFEGTIAAGQTTNIGATGVGSLAEQPLGGTCPLTRTVQLVVTISDPNTGNALSAGLSGQ